MRYSSLSALFDLIGTIAALLIATPAISADEPVLKPEVRVGDSWTYRITNARTKQELLTSEHVVTFVGPESILTTSTRFSDKTESDSNWTAEWNALALGSGEVYEAPRRFFKFPMNVGDTFETEYKRVAQRGSPETYKNFGTARVVGWEEVEVPAGKFRALKVEIKGTFQRLDVRFTGRFQHAYWYVPEVERWVKYEFGDDNSLGGNKLVQELLKFQLK